MKKILFLILILVLAVSCHRDTKTIALVSEAGIEIYSRGSRSASCISFDAATVKGLAEANQKSPKEVASLIVPQAECFYANGVAFLERKELYQTLVAVTDSDTVPTLWKTHKSELEDSRFLTHLASGSNGFDSALVDLVQGSRYEFTPYRAEDVLEDNCDYTSAIVFLKRWIKAIIG